VTHTPEQANGYIERLLTALHADDRAAFEAAYQDALATSDPKRPMFLIVNFLVANLVLNVQDEVAAEYRSADNLIRDALRDVTDPWQKPDKGDTQ